MALAAPVAVTMARPRPRTTTVLARSCAVSGSGAPGIFVDRHGFAGQRGLVDQERGRFQEAWRRPARRRPPPVPGRPRDDVGGGRLLLRAVAQHPGGRGGQGGQGGDGVSALTSCTTPTVVLNRTTT